MTHSNLYRMICLLRRCLPYSNSFGAISRVLRNRRNMRWIGWRIRWIYLVRNGNKRVWRRRRRKDFPGLRDWYKIISRWAINWVSPTINPPSAKNMTPTAKIRTSSPPVSSKRPTPAKNWKYPLKPLLAKKKIGADRGSVLLWLFLWHRWVNGSFCSGLRPVLLKRKETWCMAHRWKT